VATASRWSNFPVYPSVPSYLFKKDKQTHFHELKKNQISSTSTESPTKFQAFEAILQMAGLLTLCMGIRNPPVPTEANPHGYRTYEEIVHKGRTYVMPAKDVHKFQHDLERTFDCFHAQFHPSAHYISAQGFYQQDRIQFYKDMMKHFQGHHGNDVLPQVLILMQLRINPNLSIQEEVARLDYALGHEFEVEVKLAAHFQFYKRPGVFHYICNLKFTKVSYEVARIGIEDITSPVAIGATTPHHTMKLPTLLENIAANGLPVSVPTAPPASITTSLIPRLLPPMPLSLHTPRQIIRPNLLMDSSMPLLRIGRKEAKASVELRPRIPMRIARSSYMLLAS
jgi:hypothetical protein